MYNYSQLYSCKANVETEFVGTQIDVSPTLRLPV